MANLYQNLKKEVPETRKAAIMRRLAKKSDRDNSGTTSGPGKTKTTLPAKTTTKPGDKKKVPYGG